MSRGWKPGDVAMVECSDGEWRRAGYRRAFIGNPEAWEFEDGAMRRVNESRTRPLVVIDPEDREQVERLAKGLPTSWALFDDDLGESSINAMQAALRSLITPRPPEPTGLGAVVEDEDGRRWTRSRNDSQPWCGLHGVFAPYYRIAAVKVLSEGVA